MLDVSSNKMNWRYLLYNKKKLVDAILAVLFVVEWCVKFLLIKVCVSEQCSKSVKRKRFVSGLLWQLMLCNFLCIANDFPKLSLSVEFW